MSYRILFVDDEESIRDLYKVSAKMEGHHADTAESVDQALEMIAQNPSYDIYVTDKDMPVRNGFDFIDETRDMNIPLLLISGGLLEGDKRRLSEWDIPYLEKPTDIGLLYNTIKNLIRQ